MFSKPRRRTKSNNWTTPVVGFLVTFSFLSFNLRGFGLCSGILGLGAAYLIASASAKRNALSAARWRAVGSYFELAPELFERHVATTFRYMGYQTRLTPRIGDQGVDVLASRAGEVIAIQCKRYSDRIPNSAVQAVHAGRTHYGCNRSILVGLGGFTPSATALAQTTGVELIDGSQYADMVRRVAPSASNLPRFALPSGRALGVFLVLVVYSFVFIAIDATRHFSNSAAR